MEFFKEFMTFYKIPPGPPLQRGELRAEALPRAIQKNPEVIAAYLGTDWQG